MAAGGGKNQSQGQSKSQGQSANAAGGTNLLIRLAFDGTGYHGFQVQQNAVSVCAVLQDAMLAVLGERPDVKGCSRTDAGVHARDFCVSFFSGTDIPPQKLPLALNSRLPQDIRVFAAQRVPPGFHARYAAAGKEYHYHILNSAVDDPFTRRYTYRVPQPLDVPAMQTAAAHFLGRQNFAAFMAAGGKPGDTHRTVTKAEVAADGPRLTFMVAADGFLYNMVRIMAGTLLAAGLGALAANEVPAVIAGQNRAAAGDTLPAKGLFLHRVFYPDEALKI